MSKADREKWDQRYLSGSYAQRVHPTALLAEWEARLPPGRALDLACGAGRNSLFLARAGRPVDAVDVSQAGLELAQASAAAQGLDVRFVRADLETEAERVLTGTRYALILVVRYVNRSLLPRLGAALEEGGCLLVEQHLVTDAEVAGPGNPAFRYAPNELLRAMADAGEPVLRVLFYRESLVEDPDGRRAALAQLVACRGRPEF
ncbi:MAG TPA: methyltransferase domain-containing protein [Gammaproteobacteria bacterium]|nr:methyltransferase domain-containing protein [Gammaproteobacteria bacterium]